MDNRNAGYHANVRKHLQFDHMKRTIPKIDRPLYEERQTRGINTAIQVNSERVKRVIEEVVGPMNVRRPKGSASVGALIDAIFHGKVALVRRDDTEARGDWVGKAWPVERQQGAGHRGCPED